MTGRELLAKLAFLDIALLDLPVIAVGVNVFDMEGVSAALDRLVEWPAVPAPRLEIRCLDVECWAARAPGLSVVIGDGPGPGGT